MFLYFWRMNLFTCYSHKARWGRGTNQGHHLPAALVSDEHPIWGGDPAEVRGGQVLAWQGLCF